MLCQDWHRSVAGVPDGPDHLQPLADRSLDIGQHSAIIVVAPVLGAGKFITSVSWQKFAHFARCFHSMQLKWCWSIAKYRSHSPVHYASAL